MKLNKSDMIFAISIILFILLLFLPNIIDLIPSKEVKSIILIILAMLTFIAIIFETYDDLTKKQFTTTIYIILADIIEIIAFGILGYLSFKSYDTTNIEVILKRNDHITAAKLFFLGAILVRSFFKSQRFKKKS